MPPLTEFLCIGCLEARLGRRLTKGDFIEARINDLTIAGVMRYAWSGRTPRLIDRLDIENEERPAVSRKDDRQSAGRERGELVKRTIAGLLAAVAATLMFGVGTAHACSYEGSDGNYHSCD